MIPSIKEIFFPSLNDRGVYVIGTSWIKTEFFDRPLIISGSISNPEDLSFNLSINSDLKDLTAVQLSESECLYLKFAIKVINLFAIYLSNPIFFIVVYGISRNLDPKTDST